MTDRAADFSTRRALKHAGVVVLAGILLAAAALPWVRDPHRYGEGVDRLALFLALAAAGLSWLWQTGRRRAAVTAGLVGAGLA